MASFPAEPYHEKILASNDNVLEKGKQLVEKHLRNVFVNPAILAGAHGFAVRAESLVCGARVERQTAATVSQDGTEEEGQVPGQIHKVLRLLSKFRTPAATAMDQPRRQPFHRKYLLTM